MQPRRTALPRSHRPVQPTPAPHAVDGPTTGPRLAFLRRWVSPLVIIGLWQLLSIAGVIDPSARSPRPRRSPATAVDLVQDGTLGAATLVSVQRVLIGFVIGAMHRRRAAVVAGLSRIGEDAIDPPMQMLRTLPHFGLIPLFIIWMGIGETPKIALIALGVTFPLYLNTFARHPRHRPQDPRGGPVDGPDLDPADPPRDPPRRAPPDPGRTATEPRHRVAVADRRGDHQRPTPGSGYMINHAREFLQTDVIVVGLAVYSLLGLATDSLVRYLERKALAWRA